MKSLFKVVILGDPSVGKTSLRKRYMGRGFSTNYLPTMGADFAVVNLDIDDNTEVELQIWDLAGQQSFDLLIPRFISHSHGALFVFDITRRETFVNISNWIKKFRENNKETFAKLPLVLVANKTDLPNHDVKQDEIEQYRNYIINKIGKEEDMVLIYRTSALTGENVKALFEEMVQILLKKMNK